ncbi:hypothetical protein T4B_9129 [Trichinella pseudospiralis]|uniref:Uncharacterized protein n=1 Tax=Trichinella pseudospiralis TaxID=6337 RepID=A0A0V1G7N1_TRIPS|nr:hypothetical protein T4B_9129 [Trichinella pseudospiralis]
MFILFSSVTINPNATFEGLVSLGIQWNNKNQ